MTNINSPPDKKSANELQREVSHAREEFANTSMSIHQQPDDAANAENLIDPMIMFSGERDMTPQITLSDGTVLIDPMKIFLLEDGTPYRPCSTAVSQEKGISEELPLNTVPTPAENHSTISSYSSEVPVNVPSLPTASTLPTYEYQCTGFMDRGIEERNSSVPVPETQYPRKMSDLEFNTMLRACVSKSMAGQNSHSQVYYNPNQEAVSRFTPYSPKDPGTVSGNRRISGTNPGTQPQTITAEFKDISDSIARTEDSSEKKKPKPIDTAREFIQVYPMMTVASDIYIYEGTRYQRQSDLDVERLIVKCCPAAVGDVGNPKFVTDVYKCLLQNPDLAHKGLEINQDIVSFRNGVLDLEDGKFYKHSPLFINISTVECTYNPNAACPMFLNFLNQITGGNAVLIERIMQMIGYLLTTKDDAKVLFVLQGLSNTGKSLFCNLLSEMINREAVSNLDVHELDEMFSVSQLYEKVICFSADMPAAPLEAKVVSKLKQLTGFDTVAANVKHKNHIQFRSYTKFVLATNHPIYFKGNEEALLNRIVTIPFVHTIPPEQQDKNLLKKLRAEKDGIAARAIEAFFRLKANNYIFPGEYRLNEIFVNGRNRELVYSVNSCISNFIRDNIVADPNAGVFTSKAHEAFERQYGAIPFNSFAQYYNEAVTDTYTVEKMRKRMEGEKNPVSYFKGISLKAEEETVNTYISYGEDSHT